VISHKKLGPARSTALRVLAMMRGFGYRDSRRVQDFSWRRRDAASPRQIARIVVGGLHTRGFNRELGQHGGDEFRVVADFDSKPRVGSDLAIILVEHRGAMGAAGDDLLDARTLEGLHQFSGKLHEKV